MTALHANSKSDTAVLLDSASVALYVDHGPERTDLTDLTTYLEEAPSARSAIDAPRNITAKVIMRSTSDGHILELGTAAKVYSYKITMPNPGEVVCAEAGLVRATLNVPGLSGVDSTILINWSQRIEGSNVVDDVAIGNLTTGAWVFASGSHAASTPVSSHTLTIGATYGGTGNYSGGIAGIKAVHIGRRFHSATEATEDWDTQSSAPAFDGLDRTPVLTDNAATFTIAAEGNLCGPAYLLTGAATRQAAQRNVGSLVNVHINTPYGERVASSPARFYRPTPDGVAGYQWCVRYLWHAYIGLKVNVAQVRIFVRAYDLIANATISPVRFRAYSVAGLPLNGQPSPLTYYRGAIVSLTTSDSIGQWVDLGVLRLARDDAGLSYFCLGFKIDSAVGEGAGFITTWKLDAITVDPYVKTLSGGIGGDLDKESP